MEEAIYQREVGPGAQIFESHGEYHLPDYAGDIKKMLGSSARIVPTGKFFGGEEVQFAGSVHYDFWYLDSENTLTHEAFSTDYEFSCPRGNAQDGAIEASVSHFALRPSGPRRVNAKATVEGRITLREGAAYLCEADEGARLHKRLAEIEVGKRIFSSPKEREFAQSLPLPAALADAEAQILFYEASVQIESAEAQDGEVLLRGCIVFCAVASISALAPIRLCERYPFEERVALEECTPQMAAWASGYLTSLTAELSDAPDRALTFHAICEFACAAEGNTPLSVVRDAFCEHGVTASEEQTLAYEVFGGTKNLQRRLDLRVPLECEGERIDGVFYAAATLKNASCAPKDREPVFSADAEITALVYTLAEDGMPAYGARKVSAPLSVALPQIAAELAGGEYAVAADAYVCDCFIEDGALMVSLDMLFVEKCTAHREIVCVRRVRSEPYAKEGFVPTCTLCFPTEGDSLWTVAKRYAVSPTVLAAQNHISDNADDDGENLPSPMLVYTRNN